MRRTKITKEPSYTKEKKNCCHQHLHVSVVNLSKHFYQFKYFKFFPPLFLICKLLVFLNCFIFSQHRDHLAHRVYPSYQQNPISSLFQSNYFSLCSWSTYWTMKYDVHSFNEHMLNCWHHLKLSKQKMNCLKQKFILKVLHINSKKMKFAEGPHFC